MVACRWPLAFGGGDRKFTLLLKVSPEARPYSSRSFVLPPPPLSCLSGAAFEKVWQWKR